MREINKNETEKQTFWDNNLAQSEDCIPEYKIVGATCERGSLDKVC